MQVEWWDKHQSLFATIIFLAYITYLSCPYAFLHTQWSVMGMPIIYLGLMYVHRLLYVIRCFRVMAC
jgi:hypothetical protein